jgi:hypothetical protein
MRGAGVHGWSGRGSEAARRRRIVRHSRLRVGQHGPRVHRLRPDARTEGGNAMGDVVFIVLTVAFFALSWGFVRLTARL